MKETGRKYLEVLGLSANEINTYRYLVERYESTASAVAKGTGISREGAYYILSSLESKGLVSRAPNKKVATFIPESPTALSKLYEQNRQRIDEMREDIKKEVEGLEELYNLGLRGASVSYFRGVSGLKKMYDNVFYGKKPKEVIVFESSYDYTVLNSYLNEHIRKLSIQNIPQRLIFSKDSKITETIGGVKLKRNIKKLSHGSLNLPAEISVFGDKVFIASFKRDKLGIAIESKDLAESLKQIFDYIWERE